ncbi:MAG: CotH kinase family protein [Planctomycetota bacterium]
MFGSLLTVMFGVFSGLALAQEPPRLGPGGFPRPDEMREERKLAKEFDKDSNGRLDREERQAAREFLKGERAKEESARDGRGGGGGSRRPGGFGPPGGPGGFGEGREAEPATPGPKISPADVQPLVGDFYDPAILRTVFLDFDGPDWETELSEFKHTDVELPATLTVDGVKLLDVGVQFRGATSFMMVEAGHKRPLNISVDMVHDKQRVHGYRSLNFLNAHSDPSFLHTVLYFHVARRYLTAPKANFVKVVINGESWGLYVNAQQFNRDMIAEHFPSAKGARWKVPGSPRGGGGLEYSGDDVAEYKRRFEVKSGDNDKSWQALIRLCKTLNETPPEQLEEALTPQLDIDGALWFLAVDNALINNDGYWVRASDYSIYLDEHGKFHVLPHDANETFQAPGMMGGPGGRRGDRGRESAPPRTVDLDPLIGIDDATKPLRSRLLKVPSLRARYLANVRRIADEWLDWQKLGPIVDQYRGLIEKEVEADTRKLTSYAAFKEAFALDAPTTVEPGRRRQLSLKAFAEQRRKYLLNYLEPKDAPPKTPPEESLQRGS